MPARKAVVEAYFDGFRASDHRRILECLTDDVKWDLPGFAHLRGKEAFDREIENDEFVGSPTLTLDRLVEEGETVVAIGEGRTTHRSGEVRRFAFCDIFTFAGERIARVESYLVPLAAEPGMYESRIRTEGRMKLQASFEIAKWDEAPVEEWEGGKLTHASIVKRYSGDIEGDAVQEYLMSYAADGTASFVGIERVQGSAGGRRGALVLQQVGTFADGAAKATLSVVGASGELEGASGTGEMVADPAGRVTLDLAVD